MFQNRRLVSSIKRISIFYLTIISMLMLYIQPINAQLKPDALAIGHTALPSVRIMTDSFYMPQLNRYRRVWICLPHDYNKKTTKYSVIYMHDGQNVFDAKTSYAGEWGVDECMDTLERKTGKGFIIVAVDNGSDKRIGEYTAWKNSKYGGGEGVQYIDFMAKTLKPYIDKNYRTLSNKENTAMIGSSLGGLISVYAAVMYSNIYGKIGNFSPAYWINMDSLKTYIKTTKQPLSFRLYTFAGKKESATITTEIYGVEEMLKQAGLKSVQLKTTIFDDGEHREWFWRREFPKALEWLFMLK
jgi:predicted alpha/beta superfamily hydrolase